MDRIRVLVTGAGSGVGQGIVKALRASNLSLTIISTDITPMNAALFRADESVLLPKVEEKGALPVIKSILRARQVDVVMIGSEFDLEFFTRHKEEIEKDANVLVVVSPLETVLIADDKYLTAGYLKKNGLPFAESYLPRSYEDVAKKAQEWEYPVLLKPRRGTSSRHVYVIHDEDELHALFERVPTPMLQQLVAMPSHALGDEYTCGIFKCRDGRLLGPCTARRTLRGGHSWIVEVGIFEELHPLLLAIGEKLPIMGSLNVQLMIGPHGPVPFEFNARFSGTTAVRAHFGFNEPEMAIRDYFLKEDLAQPVIRKGLALRYPEEVFLEGLGANDLKEPFPKGEVRAWF